MYNKTLNIITLFWIISLQSWELKLSVMNVGYICLRFKSRLNSDGGPQTHGHVENASIQLCARLCVGVCVSVSEWNMPEGVYEHTDTNDIPELLNQVW